MSKKGFTLIELLVAIAIIGLLASIVLVSLNSARIRAKDSRIISDVQQMRELAEMYYLDKGYYNNFCASSSCPETMANAYSQLMNDAKAQGGWIVNCGCNNSHCIVAKLASGKYYCVDTTTGTPRIYNTIPTSCAQSSSTCGGEQSCEPRGSGCL